MTDTSTDPRAASSAVVSYLGLGAFAGVPLRGADDAVIGSVCALDYVPREWTPQQQGALAGITAMTGLLPGVARVAGELTVNLLDLVPLLDSLAEAFVVVDEDGAVLAWNDGATAMFGWTQEQTLGRRLQDLIFPDPRGVVVRAALAALTARTGGQPHPPQRRTVLATTRDGRRIPVEADMRALPGAAGPRICFSMLDVSARMDAQADAHLQAGFLRAVLDSLDTGIFACDAEGEPLFVNPAMASLIGTPSASLPQIVADLRKRIVNRDGTPQRPEEYASRRALDGEVVRDVPLRLTGPDQTVRYLSANAEQIVADGRVQGAVVALDDVTEAWRAQRLAERDLAVDRAVLTAATPAEAVAGVLEALVDGVCWRAAQLWLADADALEFTLAASAPGPLLEVPASQPLAVAAWKSERPRWSDRTVAVAVRGIAGPPAVLLVEAAGGFADRATVEAHLSGVAARLTPGVSIFKG
jgi:PAS domain S-box-containing protein